MSEEDRLAEQYHNRLEEEYHENLEKVSAESYRTLSKEHEELENEFESFKTEVFEYAKENNMPGLMEYLKSKEVF